MGLCRNSPARNFETTPVALNEARMCQRIDEVAQPLLSSPFKASRCVGSDLDFMCLGAFDGFISTNSQAPHCPTGVLGIADDFSSNTVVRVVVGRAMSVLGDGLEGVVQALLD